MRRLEQVKVFSGTDVTPPVEETGCRDAWKMSSCSFGLRGTSALIPK